MPDVTDMRTPAASARQRNSLQTRRRTGRRAETAESEELPPIVYQVKIGKCVLGERRRWTLSGKRYTLQNIRMAELRRLLLHRYGGPCDTDDADVYAKFACGHIDDDKFERFESWCRAWVPNLPAATVKGIIERHRRQPFKWKADYAAKWLRVTSEEREALDLRTIGAIDKTKEERAAVQAEKRRERDRERKRVKRALGGAKRRAEYEAASDAQLARELGRNRWTLGQWRKKGTFDQKVAERRAQLTRAQQVCLPIPNGVSPCEATDLSGAEPAASASPVVPVAETGSHAPLAGARSWPGEKFAGSGRGNNAASTSVPLSGNKPRSRSMKTGNLPPGWDGLGTYHDAWSVRWPPKPKRMAA